MFKLSKLLMSGVCFTLSSALLAHDAGSDRKSLDTAISNANRGLNGDFTVNFTQNVSLEGPVRALNSNPGFEYSGNNITIQGNGKTLGPKESVTSSRGFFIGGSNSNSKGLVTIDKLQITNLIAQGGNGGPNGGGGGGLGAGGGIFLGQDARAKLVNCTIINCKAKGGLGTHTNILSERRGGGGGGLRGNGGSIANISGVTGGGGGFGGNGANADETLPFGAGGGASSFTEGFAHGEIPGGNFDGVRTPAGGPGIGGSAASNINGGFGGGGGGQGRTTLGGAGGFGGGGGGGRDKGGTGGFGGGGGGGNVGGDGGFGGGGGGSVRKTPGGTPGGKGGFGGTDGLLRQGGQGASFGGAIFLQRGAELTIEGNIILQGNQVTSTNGSVGASVGALGSDIFMMSSSLLRFNLKKNVFVILKSAINGNEGNGGGSTTTGGLDNFGEGSLTLNGNNTYTGITKNASISTLIINGAILGSLENSGKVFGDFTINKVKFIPPNPTSTSTDTLTLASPDPLAAPPTDPLAAPPSDFLNGGFVNSGILILGINGVGENFIDGEFINNQGTYVVNVTPQKNNAAVLGLTASKITLNGGTLKAFANAGNYIEGTEYHILKGPISGHFSKVKFIGFGKDFLKLTKDDSTIVVTQRAIFEHQNIDSGLQSALVECLRDAVIPPHEDLAKVVVNMGFLDNDQVNNALYDLSPVNYGALEWINARNNSYVATLLSQHMFELCCSPRDCCSCTCNSSVWLNVFGNLQDTKERFDNLRPYFTDGVGLLGGWDLCFNSFYLGASLGYTHNDLNWKHSEVDIGKINTYTGALYGSYQGCWLTADFSLIGGGSSYDLNRPIEFPQVNRIARSDFWGQFFTGHFGVRSDWDCGCSTFEPFALVDYHYFHRNGFTEKGADSINLVVKGKDQSILRGEAGLKWIWNCGDECSCFSPYLGFSYVGEFPLDKSKQKAHFIDQNCEFSVTSYDSTVNLASPEVGFKWTRAAGYSFIFGYKGLFNDKVRVNQVEGRLEWIF